MSLSPFPEGRDGVLSLVPDNTPQRPPDAAPPPSQMTEDQLREAEPDVVDYLFRSHDASALRVGALELRRFEVPQKDADGRWIRDAHGRPILGPLVLHVHALYQRDIDDVARRTRRVKRRDERGRLLDVPDPVELACRTIEAALVDEDRDLLNDRRMRDKFQAGDVPGVIARMLYAGEALRAADLVRRISDIPLELTDETADLVGNSSSAAEDN